MVLKPPTNEEIVLAPAAGATATPAARRAPTAPAVAASVTRCLDHMALHSFPVFRDSWVTATGITSAVSRLD